MSKAQGGYKGKGKLEAPFHHANKLAADDGSSDNASSTIIWLRRLFLTPSLPPLMFLDTFHFLLAPLNLTNLEKLTSIQITSVLTLSIN